MPATEPAGRTAPAAETGAAATPVHCFTVTADPEPGMLPRLLAAIAKRGLTPSRVHAAVGSDGAEMTVDLQVPGLGGDTAEIVGATLRAMVGVEGVLVAAKAPRAAGGLAA